MGELYLISAETLGKAFERAREKQLRRMDWVYIPLNGRKQYIKGRRVSDAKYLIGWFSVEEREYLLTRGRKVE